MHYINITFSTVRLHLVGRAGTTRHCLSTQLLLPWHCGNVATKHNIMTTTVKKSPNDVLFPHVRIQYRTRRVTGPRGDKRHFLTVAVIYYVLQLTRGLTNELPNARYGYGHSMVLRLILTILRRGWRASVSPKYSRHHTTSPAQPVSHPQQGRGDSCNA